MNLNEDIIWKLKCPSCVKWLIPPVYSCFNGHSICNICVTGANCTVCKTDISNTSRNFILEEVIELLRYPCQNKELGCNESLHISELNMHFQSCRYRHYKCKLDEECKWRGRQNEIAKHSISEHDTKILIGNEVTRMWKSTKPDYEVYLMMAHDQLFYIHRKLKQRTMYWTVQYIGNSEDVILYCFQIDIFTDQFSNRKMTFSEICHDDIKDDIDELLETGFCAAIPMSIVETYENLNEAVFYKITINKV